MNFILNAAMHWSNKSVILIVSELPVIIKLTFFDLTLIIEST